MFAIRNVLDDNEDRELRHSMITKYSAVYKIDVLEETVMSNRCRK